jgi:hypothetical protein
MAAVRQAVARAAAREAEGSTCSLCMERPQGVVFGCGHQVQLILRASRTPWHTVEAAATCISPEGSRRRCPGPSVLPAGVRRLQQGAMPKGVPILPRADHDPHQPLQELTPPPQDARTSGTSA